MRCAAALPSSALALTLACCGGATPPDRTPPETPTRAEPVATESAPEPDDGGRDAPGRCLPVVNGCGCAYVCGLGVRQGTADTFEVVHDLHDSATTTARVERWCFDEAGRGSPSPATAGDAGYIDVFYDQTPCGGECIPTTAYLACHLDGGACIP